MTVDFSVTWTGDRNAFTNNALFPGFVPPQDPGDLLINFLHWWTFPLDFSEYQIDDGLGYAEHGWTQDLVETATNLRLSGGSDDRMHVGHVISDGFSTLIHGWEPDFVRVTQITVDARGAGHTIEGTYINEKILDSSYATDLSTGGSHVLLFVITQEPGLTHNADEQLALADINNPGDGYPVVYCLLYETGDPSIDLAFPTDAAWVTAVAIDARRPRWWAGVAGWV